MRPVRLLLESVAQGRAARNRGRLRKEGAEKEVGWNLQMAQRFDEKLQGDFLPAFKSFAEAPESWRASP